MDKGKQVRIIAVIMMVIALTFGYWTAVHAEETEEEQTVETTTQETQKDDGQTIDETKQKLEEISTKVDKVDNQIASQKVDSEKIAEQAKDIEALKEDLTEVKATLQSIPQIPSYGNNYTNLPYDVGAIIPLRTSKPYYIYKLTVGPFAQSLTANQEFIFASNSPDLNLGWSYNNTSQKTLRIAIKNIYTEDDGRLKQPICGCKIDSNLTQEQAIQLVKNPNNWGYTTLTENPSPAQNQQTITWGYELCNSKNDEWALKDGPSVILTPYGEQYVSEEQEGPEYFTGLGTLYSSGTFLALYEYEATGNPNNLKATLEILETVEPYHQEWTTEQLYMPVLIIMSILVIILFKKH